MLLLLLLLLWTAVLSSRAQSGEADPDLVPTVSCTSHISTHHGTNLSCQLVPRSDGLEDDEDEEADSIEKLTACCCNFAPNTERCVEVSGKTLHSKKLNAASLITLTALTRRGYSIQTQLDPKKIIKPKSPWVFNVTRTRDEARVYVRIPYHKDYLKEDNLQLQLQLWSNKTNQSKTHNISQDSMIINWRHLDSGTQYHVRVRAIPCGSFRGSWSDWSQPYSFQTPPASPRLHLPRHQGASPESFHLLWSILPLVVVVVVVAALIWKNKILTYMWPNIPHPKTTLVQICGPMKDLLYVPEKFSALSVYTSVSQSAEPSAVEMEPAPPSCSTQSSDTSVSASSNGTEELELLSQSSASEEETQNVPIETTVPQMPLAERAAAQQERDNSYVTMSSFYQIKTTATADRTM